MDQTQRTHQTKKNPEKPNPTWVVILRAGASPLKIKYLRHVKGGSTGRSTYVKTSADLAWGETPNPLDLIIHNPVTPSGF